MSKHPLIPLYYDQVLRFSHKNVQGLNLNPVNVLKLKKFAKQKNLRDYGLGYFQLKKLFFKL